MVEIWEFIKENIWVLLIFWLIIFIAMRQLIACALKKDMPSQNVISDQLIQSLPIRLAAYGLLLFFSTIFEILKLCVILKGVLTIMLYAGTAYLIKRSLLTKGNVPYITDKYSSVIITLELAQVMIIAFLDNNYLFTVCLLCLWGKWFWLDKTFNESIGIMWKNIVNTVKIQESTRKYGSMYKMVLVTTGIWKVLCILLSFIIPGLNNESIYLVTGLLLIISTGINVCMVPKK